MNSPRYVTSIKGRDMSQNPDPKAPAPIAMPGKLSAPARVNGPPRALKDAELVALLAIGDVLIPRSGDNPSPSELPDYQTWLALALGAFSGEFDELMATVASMSGRDGSAQQIDAELRRLDQEEPDRFFVLSSVLAGAYFMSPVVRKLIRVPSLQPDPPSLTAAADDLEDGILDAVIERGPLFTPTDDCPR